MARRGRIATVEDTSPLALWLPVRYGSSMDFADLKNDFVFRRIFARHPPLLCSLLNDLLEQFGERLIVSVEYLPVEQLALARGARFSILRAHCQDKSGDTFVVEIQLLHLPGFLHSDVYSACKDYASRLRGSGGQPPLPDVVALTLCDFELWPDDERREQGLPLVPMLSRWSMTERQSNNLHSLQVQYVFLELPKLPPHEPESGVEQWAWLFVHAPELKEVPPELPQGPYREALHLANKATFTQLELDSYQKVRDEIGQVRELAAARWAEGKAEGKTEGRAEGKCDLLLRMLASAGIALSELDRARILACSDETTLDRWADNFLRGARSAADVLS